MQALAERTGGYFTQVNPDEPVGWRGVELASALDAPRLLDASVSDAAGKELATLIEEGLARLPLAQRAAVLLVSQGHALTEVAQLLEISHANARVLVHRGRQALAHFLSPYLDGITP